MKIREKQWFLEGKAADFYQLGTHFNIDPVVARVIVNRDVTEEGEIEEYLYGNFDAIPDSELLHGVTEGADILVTALKDGAKIRIMGDYDVDGVSSTYILYKAIRELGGDVSYDIPSRFVDGYGLSLRMVEDAKADNIDVIVTCDNGIAAIDSIAKAKEYGMTVIITDHHEVSRLEDGTAVRPNADVVIDPHLPEDKYPYKTICGAVVAYKFISVVAKKMGSPLNIYDYMDFLALATDCDVMPLTKENRLYVREGIRNMKETENLGLRALMEVTDLLGDKPLSTYALGFVIGPHMNAEQRLGSAMETMKLLTTEDPEEAMEMAKAFHETNLTRQDLTKEGDEIAFATLEEMYPGDADPKVLVVYTPGVHESIAGLVASHIKERYNRPTFVLTDSTDPEILKGSGRSIEEYNMFLGLEGAKDLLVKYGGHPMAAGLSLKRSDLDAFRDRVNQQAELDDEALTPELMIDVPMPMSYVTTKLIEQLKALGPFGVGNKSPIFADKGLKIHRLAIKGRNQNVVWLDVKDQKSRVYRVIAFQPEGLLASIKLWFSEDEYDRIMKGIPSEAKVDIAYEPEVNHFNGTTTIQFMLKAIKKSKVQ